MPFFYTHAQVIIGGAPKNNWLTGQVMESGLLDTRRVEYPTSIDMMGLDNLVQVRQGAYDRWSDK